MEGDAFNRALAGVVEAQAALPMAAFWGTWRTAYSDGQFFPAAGRGEAPNLVNARYGAEPGAKAYSHVSDPFTTQTIPATVRSGRPFRDGRSPASDSSVLVGRRGGFGPPRTSPAREEHGRRQTHHSPTPTPVHERARRDEGGD